MFVKTKKSFKLIASMPKILKNSNFRKHKLQKVYNSFINKKFTNLRLSIWVNVIYGYFRPFWSVSAFFCLFFSKISFKNIERALIGKFFLPIKEAAFAYFRNCCASSRCAFCTFFAFYFLRRGILYKKCIFRKKSTFATAFGGSGGKKRGPPKVGVASPVYCFFTSGSR